MPAFKSTYNILVKTDEDEVFNENWMDSNNVIVPPKTNWDYQREIQIEDIDIWEVLYEAGGGIGIYAAWAPYAEFYLITTGPDFKNKPRIFNNFRYDHKQIETYYGPNAQQKVQARAIELKIPLTINQVWVDPNDMWLYQPDESKKTIVLPSFNNF